MNGYAQSTRGSASTTERRSNGRGASADSGLTEIPHLLYPWFGGETGKVTRKVEGSNIRSTGIGHGIHQEVMEAVSIM